MAANEYRSRNSEALASFVEYCANHPHERFWQALRNWVPRAAYVRIESIDQAVHDTFNWEGKWPETLNK